MKHYLVEVTEVLSRIVLVEAENGFEAEDIAQANYELGQIVLNEDDYCEGSGTFNTVGVALVDDYDYYEKLNF